MQLADVPVQLGSSKVTHDIGSVEILLLWSETLILCQYKSKWDHIGIPRIPGWSPLDTVEPDVCINFRTKTRQWTYLVCVVGSLQGEKFLYLAYIIMCLLFVASALRLDLHVGATSLIACSVTTCLL